MNKYIFEHDIAVMHGIDLELTITIYLAIDPLMKRYMQKLYQPKRKKDA